MYWLDFRPGHPQEAGRVTASKCVGMTMAERNSGDAAKSKGGDVPGPDVLLQIWSSWMEQISASSRPAADAGSAWWDPTKAPVSASFAGGIQHLQDALSRNPTLRSIDQMWNANPLREVIPLDWAEIARALRIVWLRALARPETAVSVMEFNRTSGARLSTFGRRQDSAGWV